MATQAPQLLLSHSPPSVRGTAEGLALLSRNKKTANRPRKNVRKEPDAIKSFLRSTPSMKKMLTTFTARFKKAGSVANQIASFKLNPTILYIVGPYETTMLIPLNTAKV